MTSHIVPMEAWQEASDRPSGLTYDMSVSVNHDGNVTCSLRLPSGQGHQILTGTVPPEVLADVVGVSIRRTAQQRTIYSNLVDEYMDAAIDAEMAAAEAAEATA